MMKQYFVKKSICNCTLPYYYSLNHMEIKDMFASLLPQYYGVDNNMTAKLLRGEDQSTRLDLFWGAVN
jgi:hypothetical protein